MEETGCEVICGAKTTPTVKGQVKVNEFCFAFGDLRDQFVSPLER